MAEDDITMVSEGSACIHETYDSTGKLVKRRCVVVKHGVAKIFNTNQPTPKKEG